MCLKSFGFPSWKILDDARGFSVIFRAFFFVFELLGFLFGVSV